MNTDKLLREAITNYLENPHTHKTLEEIVKDFPEKLINTVPDGVPYSFWQMLEHIRVSQFDMVDFIQNPNYKEMKWPEDYWPGKNEMATKQIWDNAVKQYSEDLKTLQKIVNDPESDLFAPIKHGNGQTIFREILQIIDHASYHIGEFVVMARIAKAWDK